jgi:hypothetical protein
MKNRMMVLATVLACLSLIPAYGQPGARRGGGGMGGPKGPDMGGAMAKAFGENSAFSATMEMQADDMPKGMTLSGKMACDNGKSRFEINLLEGGAVPAKDAAQMKAMGMDKMVMIGRPDKKVSYLVYPGMQGYVETPIKADAAKPAADYKVETTELGKETVEGRACVKNKVVVTDDQGQKTELTLWNAKDLKNFPVKLETTQDGHKMTMLFKDVKVGKPDAALFDPPADLKKYDDFMTMMMSRMGGAMGKPPGAQ